MNLLEKLAELEHEQWMQWAQRLIDTELGLSIERIERWKTFMVPYNELSEEAKEQDRIWARKVLTIIFNENKDSLLKEF